MPWWMASLISNAAIIVVEYLNRNTPGGWLAVLPRTAPLIVVAQWALYTAWHGAPTWMHAWVVFTLGNSCMRIAAVHAFAGHEVTSWPHAGLGILVITAGAFLVKEGLR